MNRLITLVPDQGKWLYNTVTNQVAEGKVYVGLGSDPNEWEEIDETRKLEIEASSELEEIQVD